MCVRCSIVLSECPELFSPWFIHFIKHAYSQSEPVGHSRSVWIICCHQSYLGHVSVFGCAFLYSYAAYLVHIHNSRPGFTAPTQSQTVLTGGRDFVWTAKNEANMTNTGVHEKSFCESFCESPAKVVSCSSAAQFGETVWLRLQKTILGFAIAILKELHLLGCQKVHWLKFCLNSRFKSPLKKKKD